MTGLAAFTAAAMRLPEVLEQNAVLEATDRRKDVFLAMLLAHELRNPLTPLRLGVELLKYSATIRPPSTGQRIDHMVRLFDELLNISRITQDRLELHREDVDWMEVCGDGYRHAGDEWLRRGRADSEDAGRGARDVRRPNRLGPRGRRMAMS